MNDTTGPECSGLAFWSGYKATAFRKTMRAAAVCHTGIGTPLLSGQLFEMRSRLERFYGGY